MFSVFVWTKCMILGYQNIPLSLVISTRINFISSKPTVWLMIKLGHNYVRARDKQLPNPRLSIGIKLCPNVSPCILPWALTSRTSTAFLRGSLALYVMLHFVSAQVVNPDFKLAYENTIYTAGYANYIAQVIKPRRERRIRRRYGMKVHPQVP
jgi:hypothetical protein